MLKTFFFLVHDLKEVQNTQRNEWIRVEEFPQKSRKRGKIHNKRYAKL